MIGTKTSREHFLICKLALSVMINVIDPDVGHVRESLWCQCEYKLDFGGSYYENFQYFLYLEFKILTPNNNLYISSILA